MASILPTGGTCEKYGRGFCSSACYEQKPLSFFKIPFHLPGILPGSRLVKLAKKTVLSFSVRAVLQGGSGLIRPP
jgi:hypothetical protein